MAKDIALASRHQALVFCIVEVLSDSNSGINGPADSDSKEWPSGLGYTLIPNLNFSTGFEASIDGIIPSFNKMTSHH